MTMQEADIDITVYATSDLHAHWQRKDAGIGSVLSALADLSPDERATAVFIDNGDLLTGSPLGAYLAGRDWAVGHPVLDALESAGFDVAVPGNHDFDHGTERLLAAVRQLSTMRYVCANVVDAVTGKALFSPSAVIERAGHRIGVIGAVTGHLQRLTRYRAVREIRATDPVAAVRAEAARLRVHVDLLIVAYHGGFTADPAGGEPWNYDTGEDQAGQILAIPGVDGLIAGHQHAARSGMVQMETEAGTCTAYAQPGYAGSHLAVLRFEVTRGASRALAAEARPTAAHPADPAHPLAALTGESKRWLDSSAPLDDTAVHAIVRTALSERGSIVADSLLDLPAQPRSWAQLAAAFPAPYGASVLRMPAAELAALTAAARPHHVSPDGEIPAEQARDEDDVFVASNASLVQAAAPGRIHKDLIIDWLDEFVWALRPSLATEEPLA